MKGDEVLVMTSRVIIFAVFLRRRRSFIQQMRLMFLQMRKMRRNLLILSMQQRNNIQCHNWDKRKTMWVYPRPQFWFKDLAEEIDIAVGSAFSRTSYTISRGSISLREFPLVKARKSLVFACENSLHF